jgi:hypothetical protein
MARLPVRDPKSGRIVFALVDDADLPMLASQRWRLNHDGNVVGNGQHPTKRRHRQGKGSDKRPCTLRLHRVILGLELGDGRLVRHINGDRLDHQRSNLRVVDRKTTARNPRPRSRQAWPWPPFGERDVPSGAAKSWPRSWP